MGIMTSLDRAEMERQSKQVTDAVEMISANVHEGWMATKRAQGVESRLSERGEELMKPYRELSEPAKDLDRGTVKAVLAALPKAGFSLRPADVEPPTGVLLTGEQPANLLAYLKGEKFDAGVIADIRRALETFLA
jgi:hypothetical protein